MYINLRLKLPDNYSTPASPELDINPMPVQCTVVITDFMILPTGKPIIYGRGLFHDFILAN